MGPGPLVPPHPPPPPTPPDPATHAPAHTYLHGTAPQIRQLTKLIEVTRTDLPKPDRQKIMNMITIDTHSRDMVLDIAQSGATESNCFQWVSQLRSYWDRDITDCRIRICDASFPYGYEYLGNGARLVVTPLTDRIYITATQVRVRDARTLPPPQLAGGAGAGRWAAHAGAPAQAAGLAWLGQLVWWWFETLKAPAARQLAKHEGRAVDYYAACSL